MIKRKKIHEMTDAELLELPIIKGADEGEGDGGEGQGSDGQGQGQEGQGQQAPQGEDGRFIPRERFDKVYGQYAEYKKFGKVSDIQAKLAKFEQYEKAIQDHRSKSQETDENRAIKDRLFQVAPELKALLESQGKLGTIEQQIAEMREAQISQRMDKADEYFDSKIKTEIPGIALSEKQKEWVAKVIWSDMDADQRKEFLKGDFSYIDEFIKANKEEIFSKFVSGKPAAPKPFSRIGSQGAPQPGKDVKPKSMAEAASAAWDTFNSA